MTSAKRDKTADAESLFLEAEQYEEMGDFRNAFKRLLAAAQLGHHMSQLNLGNFYASGTGVRRNLEKAAHWYQEAYKNGNNDGAFNLAIDRRNEGNVRSAVIWFKKAIAMNHGEACIALAKIYNARKGGQKAAVDLLRRALRMSRDDISDLAKEEAESLLEEMRLVTRTK
ncbi:MAG: tetratricopeptide repeat protein [Terriglobales bacterium]